MLTRLRHRAQGQEGFTLIELLVVILIIGILAAVAIPVFLNQQGKAQDANAKSDITNAATAEETYFTDNQTYATVTGSSDMTALTAIDPTLANAITSTTEKMAVAATKNSYDITADSADGIQFELKKASDGTIQHLCTVPANTNPGGCVGASQVSSGTSSGTWTQGS